MLQHGAARFYVEPLSPTTDGPWPYIATNCRTLRELAAIIGVATDRNDALYFEPGKMQDSMKIVLSHAPQMLAVVATAMWIAGCSKEPAPTPPSTPLVEQRAADPAVARVDEFRGSFAPGGIEANYRATFSAGQIHTLEETRKATSQTGIYEFRGARLIKYHGAALRSDDTIDLEFDVRGKLLTARAGDKNMSAEEIAAISDRAQSLRSHAVAQHAVQGHDRN